MKNLKIIFDKQEKNYPYPLMIFILKETIKKFESLEKRVKTLEDKVNSLPK
jgi:hypothetical protein